MGPNNISTSTGHSNVSNATGAPMKELRKVLKVRKVKSEMKYVEPMSNSMSSKKKESKSDHEFANETDVSLTPFQSQLYEIFSSYLL